MSKTRNRFSPEVRERAVRMVGEHRADYGYGSEWSAMTSIAAKIGCTAGQNRDRLKLTPENAGKRPQLHHHLGHDHVPQHVFRGNADQKPFRLDNRPVFLSAST